MSAHLQRGMAEGWIVGGIAALLAAAAIVVAGTAYLRHVDSAGYERGKAEAEKAYAQRDNDALQKANARIQALEEAARAQEREHAQRQAAITTQLNKERAKNAQLMDDDRKRIADGFRLRDPGAAGCAPPGGGGTTGQAAGPGSPGNAAPGAELSREATEFLFSEAARANAIVAQLTAAQAVILDQIRTCNGP